MKTWTLGLVSLLAATANATAEAQFNAICDNPPATEQEIEPGVFVKYHCDKNAGRQAAVTYVQLLANSPKACALACADLKRDGAGECIASVWNTRSSKPCFGIEETSLPTPQRYRGALLMTTRDIRLPPDERDDLQNQIKDLEDELEECKKNGGTSSGPPGSGPPNSGTPSGNDFSAVSAKDQCPKSLEGQTFSSNGRNWKLFCGYVQGSNTVDLVKPVNLSAEECLDQCAAVPEVTHVMYEASGKRCFCRKNTKSPGKVDANRASTITWAEV